MIDVTVSLARLTTGLCASSSMFNESRCWEHWCFKSTESLWWWKTGNRSRATNYSKKWSKFLHLPEYHKTRSLASLRHFTPMKEITLVRCSSHSKSSDDRFTAKAFLDGILIRKPRQDGVLVSVISIFRLYVESDGMCSLWETKTYRETRYSRWSLGDSPCGIMQFFFLSLFLSCLSGSACRRWVAIRLVSHRTKTNVSQQAAGSERIES